MVTNWLDGRQQTLSVADWISIYRDRELFPTWNFVACDGSQPAVH
jgi:hypothetical protein